MSRPLRIQYPGAWNHVMNRGSGGRPIFIEKADYQGFADLLTEAVAMWNMKVSAYCLMPNHYHLLVQTPGANLSKCMMYINGVYTQRFNRDHRRGGQLFRGRYKSILIDADSYVLELVRYIHRNPLEAGLVDRLDNYVWSSHKGYLSDAKKWNWLYKDFVLTFFSNDSAERRKRYKAFVSKKSPEEVNQILGRKKLPSVLGSEKFVDWVKTSSFREKLDEEVPESKSLAPDPKRIKDEVCKAFGVDRAVLTVSQRGIPNEPRAVAIYLFRRLRGDRLDEIGKEFGMEEYSSVSSVIQRMKTEISTNRKLRKRVSELEATLQMSQEQI